MKGNYTLLAILLVSFGVFSLQGQVTTHGSESQVNTTTLQRQAMPAMAMDLSRNFVVTWHSLNQVTTTSDYDIYFQRFSDDGATSGTETLVNTTTGNTQSHPDVAMAADGRFAICWMSIGTDGDGFGIYSQQYTSAGASSGSQTLVNTTTTKSQRFPRISSDPNMNYVITWEDEAADGDDWGIYFQRFNSLGTTLGIQTLVNTTTAGAQHFPDVAVDANGNYVIVWQGINGSGDYDIYAQRYNSSGVAQGSEMTINSTTSGHQIAPRVAIDENGNFAINWTSEGQDGDGEGIYAAVFDNTGTSTVAEFKVNVTTAGAQDYADIHMLKQGGFAITWNSFGQDGDKYGVYMNAYNSIGQITSATDLLVNTTTTNYQQFPAIASYYNTDSLVIAWQSGARHVTTTQDGSDYGIYFQREEAIVPVVLIASCKNITIQLDGSGNASYATSEIDDGSFGLNTPISLAADPTSFTCSNTGGNTVTLTVTDALSNTNSCSATVTVEDNIPPSPFCQNATVFLDASGNGSITGAVIDNGSTDICGIQSLDVSPNAFGCAQVGNSNAVTLTVTDDNNNTAFCTANVTVTDNIVPTASCQPYTVQLDANGDGFLVASNIDNNSTDACGIQPLVASPTAFTCNQVGSGNSVTLTVTDVNGNSNTCDATVTIVDGVAPTPICQPHTVQLDASGDGAMMASDIDNNSSDACGIQSLNASMTAFTCTNLGNGNTITLTVTDVNGNTSSCSAGVTVEDNVPPTALCQAHTVQLDQNGNGSLAASDIDNASSDACSVQSISASPTTFDCSHVGSTQSVTLTVTDGSGNTASCDAPVTVEDNIPPTAFCQTHTVNLDASGNGTLMASDIDNNSSDACGVQSLAASSTAFACAHVGSNNNITLTVTDVNGNTSSCSAIVTVEDNIPPTALCQAHTIQLDGSGNGSLVASDINNGSTDACGIQSMSASPTSFACSDVGSSHSVTLTVTDVNGNTASCSANVTVQDNVPPTASCQPHTIQLDATGNGSLAASDIDNNSSAACGIQNISAAPTAFTCSNVGSGNSVTLRVTDVNGNTASCSATVTVEDNVPPTALCQPVTAQLDASGNVTVAASSIDNNSSDACGIQNLSLNPSGFDCSHVSVNNIVTLTVTDANGNSATCNATVQVEDNVAPTAICQDITVDLDSNGDASITASDVDNGSSDACGIASLSVSPSAFDCDDLLQQTRIVTLTVIDNHGNSSQCTSEVTLEDPLFACCVLPEAYCQDITVSLDAQGMYSLAASEVDNGSTADCGVQSLVVSPNTFDCDDVGSNTVTLTITDINAESADCTANVMVKDVIPPTALCQALTIQLDNGGNASISASEIDNGSSDVCGIESLSASSTTFTCTDIGSNIITLTVTDNNSNTSTCASNVLVEDNIAPIATCQPATVVLSPVNGMGSITGSDVDNGSSDACGIASTSVSPNTFDCSMVGSNTVTLTVTDNNGNTATCTTTVTVDDSQSKPATLAQQSCGNCGEIRIFYCQFDANPASLNDFIDGTVATNANFVAGNGLLWYDDNSGTVGTAHNGTGQEPATPNMNLAARTYWYWVSQVDQNTGCIGDPIRVRVRVRKTPTPVFNSPSTPFCEGGSLNLAARVDDPNNVADRFDFYNGDPNNGGVLIGSATATNGSVNNGQVVVATPVVGSNTYWVVATNTGNNNSITCPATSSMTFVVSPTPLIAPISNITACPGDPVNVNILATPSAGAAYVWTNSNTAIGLGPFNYGFSNSISFTAAANSSGAPLLGTIAVRVLVNGCASGVEIFDISINSDAVINPVGSGAVCSGQATGLVLSTAVGSPQAASYELVSVSLDPGLSADGGNQGTGSGLSANALANDVFTNTTSAPLTATYSLRSVTATNCTSGIQTVTATILPEPVVTANLADTVCSGQPANLVLTTANSLLSTSFSWSPQSLPAGISLLSSSSPGTVISDVLTNSTASPIDVIYDVTALSGSCSSAPATATLRVVPFPLVPPTATLSACEELATPGQATFDLTSLDATIGSGLAVNYFSDPNLVNQIPTPAAFVRGSTTVYASVVSPNSTCPNRTDVSLNVISLAVPQLSSSTFPCNNTSQEIVPAPLIGISFNFYDGDPAQGGFLLGSGASYDPMLSTGQSQTIWVTATDGVCESDAVATTVTVNPAPTASISSNLNNGGICIGDTLELFGAGNGSFSWRGPNNFSSTLQNPRVEGFGALDSGNYILTVTNAFSCSSEDTLYIVGNRAKNPGQNGTLTIAANAPAVNLFDYLLGTPERGGVWAGPSAPYNGDDGTFNPNFMLPGLYTYALTNPASCIDSVAIATVLVNVTPVTAAKVRARVYLEGVLDTTNLLMVDSLRAKAFMPTVEPFSALGYAHVNGGGSESFPHAQLALTGPNALVDWVYLELRSASDPTHIVATRSALLQRDGDIVELDGASPVCFNRVSPGFYYVVVGHRNHVPVMTGVAVFLNSTGSVNLDFTTSTLPLYGTNPMNVTATSVITGGVRVLIGGDADFNGQIQNSDDVIYWSPSVGGAGYRRADYDGNGEVQNNDRVFIWAPNVGKGTAVPARSN